MTENEWKNKYIELRKKYDYLLGESAAHKFVADQATSMLTKEQKAQLAIVILDHLLNVTKTHNIENN